MKYKIGIIGPQVLVKDISEVVSEFHELEAVPLIYESEYDAPKLIQQAPHLDIYMFSGLAPYCSCKKMLTDAHLSYVIPFEGTDIYKAMLDIYMTYHFFPIISFDGIHKQHLKETREEMGITHIPFHLQEPKEKWDRDAFYEKHVFLWKNKKTQIIATCANSVYQKLKEINAPVYLIKHTKQVIRESIQQALLLCLKRNSHETQSAVLLLKCEKTETNELLQYSSDISGLFSGSGALSGQLLTIYTTRGIVERVTDHFTDFSIIQSTAHSSILTMGIGYGQNVDKARHNAEKAMKYAGGETYHAAYLLDDDQRISGPFSLEWEHSSPPLSVSTQNHALPLLWKLHSWLKGTNMTIITSRDMSAGLNTTIRHATRVLKDLHEKGIAQIAGLEHSNGKGRPRTMYRIDMAELESLLR